MGIERAWLADVARLSMEDHCTKTNARTPSEADYRAILDEAF
jgi:alcohol dehydrogenase class IV